MRITVGYGGPARGQAAEAVKTARLGGSSPAIVRQPLQWIFVSISVMAAVMITIIIRFNGSMMIQVKLAFPAGPGRRRMT